MISVDIDTSALSEEFSLTDQEVSAMSNYAVQEIASQFGRNWQAEAQQNLSSTRNIYINNLGVEQLGPGTVAVYLNPNAWLPNAIERGASSFDMKEGLLRSPKAKISKKGKRYIVVPFRHATPTALGENAVFSGVMPVSVHNEARKLQPKQSLKLDQIDKKHHIPKNIGLRKQFKNENFSNITAKTKMTSIYEGMTRGKGGYVTFRVVSEESDDERFIHPGFVAREFAEKALQQTDVARVADVAIDNYLSKLGF